MILPKISIIIRTYNESAYIARLLDVLATQEDAGGTIESVVIDSGSTDDTIEIAQGRVTRLLHIRKEDFDYSRALNQGIQNSSGEFIAILSAHSIPCDARWLSTMLSHFDDPCVAGVFSRQIPWPETYWWERRRIRKEFGEEATVYHRTNSAIAVPFSNSASCIRRSLWQEHPFVLPTGEDGEWATWAVSQGYRIIYEPRAVVYHSHNESCRRAMRRVVEFERAADTRFRRNRTGLLTIKQAGGLVFRDLRDVLVAEKFSPSCPRLVWESLVRGYWFVRHFEGRR